MKVKATFRPQNVLLRTESCSKRCDGSSLDTGLVQFSSWINKSLHCHNGALLTPAHSHTNPHMHTHTHTYMLSHTGRHWNIDSFTPDETPDPSQTHAFLTPKRNPQLFPRLLHTSVLLHIYFRWVWQSTSFKTTYPQNLMQLCLFLSYKTYIWSSFYKSIFINMMYLFGHGAEMGQPTSDWRVAGLITCHTDAMLSLSKTPVALLLCVLDHHTGNTSGKDVSCWVLILCHRHKIGWTPPQLLLQ